jgi:putative ABC transport system substrate-binding protein
MGEYQMKKGLVSLILSSILLLTACGGGGETAKPGASQPEPAKATEPKPKEEEKVYKIGITQIVEHPALDAARAGFLAALKDGGFEEGKNLEVDVQFAQGDMNNNITIAQKFVSDKVDLISAIATPSAQAAVKASKDIPIIFSMISDPVGAKLVESLEKPGGMATGSSSNHPDATKLQIEAIKAFIPEAKKVGIIYNSGEQNSVVSVEEAKKELVALGLEPVEVAITATTEVISAAQSLVGRVDAIYFPQDNTVISALEGLVKVANENDIPLFVPDSTAVKRGGFLTFSFDYHDLGYTTGKLAVEVLKGKNPADLAVVFPENLKMVINEQAAAEQGITLTDEMKKDAELVTTE